MELIFFLLVSNETYTLVSYIDLLDCIEDTAN